MPENVSPITEQLATYIAGATRQPLPPAVEEKTKHHVLDTIAAMVSGSKLLPGRRAIAYAKARGGVEEATVVGTRIRTTVELAALANGMMAHADETDDSHAGSVTHPGCAVVPAALALGERHKRNGAAFLRAVALGYDVGSRFSMALDARAFFDEGHSTHSFAPSFGAAAAAATLSKFDADQVRHTLSYAGQQASGVGAWIHDLEHVEKAFDFGGMPSRNGALAVTFVRLGFTAVDDLFVGPRNFFQAYGTPGRQPHPEVLVRGLGETFEVMNTNIKRWTVGSPIQAPLDSLYELIREHQVKASNVEHVTVTVGPHAALTVDDRKMPDINMQHMCAVMLLDGTATFEAAHDEPRMRDKKTRELRARVELIGDAEWEQQHPGRQGAVEILLKDGTKLSHHTTAVRGTSENPMTRQEVHDKCHALMAPVLGTKKSRALCETVWELESMKDVRDLAKMLRA